VRYEKSRSMRKNIIFDKKARASLLSGIAKTAKAVGSTMGPFGRTVIIEDRNTTRGTRATKDGVTVAKNIDHPDSVEQLANVIVREAAELTAKQAGDGTTASMVLAHALVKRGVELMDDNPGMNMTELLRDTKEKVEQIAKELTDKAVPVTDSNIESVATISVNNDPELGGIIADAFRSIGEGGVVHFERSKSAETYYDVSEGIQIDRGWTSPLFKTDKELGECVLEDCYILFADMSINSLQNITEILEVVIKQKKGLLIVGEISQGVINALGANVVHNSLKLCHIEKPSFGWKTKPMMRDLAAATGGKVFSHETGDDLQLAKMEDLGYAEKVIITKEKTAIFSNVDYSEYLEELRSSKEDPAFKKERIAKLAGGVAIVYAGGFSETEQKELYDRIEDGVRAVESAIEMGIVPGGGVALRDERLEGHDLLSELDAPYNRIFENAHLMPDEKSPVGFLILKLLVPSKFGSESGMPINPSAGHGMDLKSGQHGNMIDMGIIDPVKVSICTLRNAFSVAAQILNTNTVITFDNASSK
jgi:chaperonin GroEL